MQKILLTLPFLFIHFPAEELTIEDSNNNRVQVIKRSEVFTSIEDPLFIDHNKKRNIAGHLNQQVYQKPENAKVLNSGAILPEKTGLELDYNQFEKQYIHFLAKGDIATLQIPTKRIHPRVTAEVLSEIKEKKIGAYVTYFPKQHAERTLNIKLAAKAIDSHVIFPGERFSFNKVVGERTEERGYERAPVIIKGEFAEDVGGGICQVSSTLYNAVNLEGVEIVERYAHSRDVSYVPPGKDATVSWHGPDFAFVNRYNQPLLIRASAQNGQMQISIFTSEDAEST